MPSTSKKIGGTKKRDLLVLTTSFEAFWGRYPNKMNKLAAKKLWIKMAPPDGSKFMEELTDGLEAHLQWGCLREFPPMAVNWLKGQRWKDPLPPTERQLTRDYERDPVAFILERKTARMACVQQGWGSWPTPRQRALSAMRMPRKWLTDNNFPIDVVPT